jgi:hypothetical protein
MTLDQIVHKKYGFYNNICKHQNINGLFSIINWGVFDIIFYLNSYKEILTLRSCGGAR